MNAATLQLQRVEDLWQGHEQGRHTLPPARQLDGACKHLRAMVEQGHCPDWSAHQLGYRVYRAWSMIVD